jgi:hypothetical protein
MTVGPESVSVQSSFGLRLLFSSEGEMRATLNGAPWYGTGGTEVILPPGDNTLVFNAVRGSVAEGPRIIDASCEILETTRVTRGLRFAYESKERACIVLNRRPIDVSVDGARAGTGGPAGERGYPLLLPPGKHVVVVLTERWLSSAFRIGSLVLSVGIVAISVLSLLIVGGLFVWGRLTARAAKKLTSPAPEVPL